MKKKGLLFVFLAAFVLFLYVFVPDLFHDAVIRQLQLTEVVCAAHDIEARTVIEESDLSFLQIPSAYLQDRVYVSKEEVLGKITTNKGFIPEGSLFYHASLEEKSEISDRALFELKEDQVLFALQTDLISLGANALLPNQMVDIYASIKTDDHETVTGLMFEHVRILGIKDHDGMDLTHPESSGLPHAIQFALSKQAIPIMKKVLSKGQVSYYASSDAYADNKECRIVWDSEILKLLNVEKEKAIE